jgi:arginine repressor
MQKRFDAEAMQLVLQYYAIIQQEIATSRRKLVQENAERDLLYKQAAVLRDIRLFACHLMVESRGKLSFSMLPPDSQQFARCVKAVMDNVQDDHYDARFRNRIRVLNVFKLQNTFLSAKLQVL